MHSEALTPLYNVVNLMMKTITPKVTYLDLNEVYQMPIFYVKFFINIHDSKYLKNILTLM